LKLSFPFLSRHKILMPILCLLCAAPAFLPAQTTAMEIETLLASDTLSWAQASRFVLEAADPGTAFDDPIDAFNFAVGQNWLPRNVRPNETARLDGIALLLMQSFGLQGGIFFTLTGSPHFAYRELEHMGILHGRISPGQMVSGETLLYLTGRVLDRVE